MESFVLWMLIFISIFILVSLRGFVEIWTRNEIEGNRSPIENRSKFVWTSVGKSEIWSFEKYLHRPSSIVRKKEKIYLFIYFNLEKSKLNGTIEFLNRMKISNPKKLYDNHSFVIGVKLLTFLLKCEVFREMTALVIASKEEQCGWMAQLKCPQVQYALEQRKRDVILTVKRSLHSNKDKKKY